MKSISSIFLTSLVGKILVFLVGLLIASKIDAENYADILYINLIYGIITVLNVGGYEYIYIQNSSCDIAYLDRIYSIRIGHSFFVVLLAYTTIIFLSQFIALSRWAYVIPLVLVAKLIGRRSETFVMKRLEYTNVSMSAMLSSIAVASSQYIMLNLGYGSVLFAISYVIGALVAGTYIRLAVKVPERFNFTLVYPNKEERRFARGFFINNAGSFAFKQVDKLLAPIFLSNRLVGFYQFAWMIGEAPWKFSVAPFGSYMLSKLPQIIKNQSALLKLLSNLTVLVNYFLFPLMSIFLLGNSIVLDLLYGDKWLEAYQIVNIVVVGILFKLLLYPSNGLLTSAGMPGLKARITVRGFCFGILLISSINLLFDIPLWMYMFVVIAVYTIIDLHVMIVSFKLLKLSVSDFIRSRLLSILQLITLGSMGLFQIEYWFFSVIPFAAILIYGLIYKLNLLVRDNY